MSRLTFILCVILFAMANAVPVSQKQDSIRLVQIFEKELQDYTKVLEERQTRILKNKIDDPEYTKYDSITKNVSKIYFDGLEQALNLMNTSLERGKNITICRHYIDTLRLANNELNSIIDGCAANTINKALSVLNHTSIIVEWSKGVLKHLVEKAKNCTGEMCKKIEQDYTGFPSTATLYLNNGYDEYESYFTGPRTFTKCIEEKTPYQNYYEIITENVNAFKDCLSKDNC